MKLGFIGAGEMGSALLRGLLKTGINPQQLIASVRTPQTADRLTHTLGITVYTDNARVLTEADYLFIAVKPAQVAEILTQAAGLSLPAKPLICMALGWTVEKIQRILPGWPVIRMMPNTSLAIGQGVTLFEFSAQTTPALRQEIKALFEKMGRVFEIPHAQFDVATAVSGSGPAFVYAFIDALAQAAAAKGLPAELAVQLALQTVRGAAAMVQHESVSPAELAKKVATPGGCTAAGMDVLIQSDFAQLLKQAVEATAQKAQEVSSKL